ncbi:Octaprenyl diphosphate synthase [Candidatus Providencia siddallii]|uniref:Octaprenyl diphosphate synthase n=2 Tax=Candidatus Providencia siddallii TaxID=1715285 RepID=A0ABM9NPF1_9GAMM
MNKFQDLDYIIKLISDDMLAVNKIIFNKLNSDILLIKQLGNYIVNSGGKRIRPIIAILVGKSLGYTGNKHIKIAALIEFIHTATLLHDDVVDESCIRRGKKTANIIFGNASSILVGDFIYTLSFKMMIDLNSMSVLKLMSGAANIVAKGEVLQLMSCNNPNISEKEYMQIIYNKTACLFEATSHSSAILANAQPEQEKALQNYGRYIGTAFQLIDDLLDYGSNCIHIGKNIGDDLNEGKMTLPLLHALNYSSKKESEFIREIIKYGKNRRFLKKILKIMKKYGSLEYTYLKAKNESQKAIESLNIIDDSIYKTALIDLAYIVMKC